MKGYPLYIKVFFFAIWGVSLYYGATGTLNLRFKPDPMAFMPYGSREASAIKEIQKDFGFGETGIIIISFKERIGRKELLKEREIVKEILRKDGVISTLTIEDIPRPIENKEGELEVYQYTQLLINGLEDNLSFLNAVKTDSNIYKNFISEDLKSLAIYVNFDPESLPGSANVIMNYLKKRVSSDDLKFYFTGSPFLLTYLSEELLTSFRISLPMAALFFFICFFIVGMPSFTIYTLLALGTALLWTLAFLSHITRNLDFVTGAIPSVLFAAGASYVAHILIKGFKRSFIPVIFSALTTFAGFAAMVVLKVPPMKIFGIITALGVIFVALASVIVTVIFFKENPDEKVVLMLGKPMRTFLEIVISSPYISLIVAIFVAFFSLLRLGTSPVKLGMTTLFEKSSETYREIVSAEKIFKGEDFLFTIVRGDYSKPEILKASDYYESLLKKEGCSYWSQSPAQIIKQASGYLVGTPRIPLDEKKLQEILFLVEGERGFEQTVKGKEKFLILARSSGEEWKRCVKASKKAGKIVFDNLFKIVPSDRPSKQEINYLFDIVSLQLPQIKKEKFKKIIYNFPADDVPRGYIKYISKKIDDYGFGTLSRKERLELEDIIKYKKLLTPNKVVRKISKNENRQRIIKSAMNLILEKRAEVRLQALGGNSKELKGYLMDLEDGYTIKKGGESLDYVVTGSNTAFAEVDKSVKRGQVIATFLAFLLVGLCMLYILKEKNIINILSGSLSPFLAVIASLAVVSLINKNFDIGTAMASSALLGMGADFAIHFAWSLRTKSLMESVKEEAPAQFFSILLTTAGFAPLLTSDITSMKNFGAVIIIGSLFASVFSMGIIGAVYSITKRR